MRKLAVLVVALLGVVFVGGALAGETGEQVTLEGKVMCAKCTLKDGDFKDCQTVLQVQHGDETVNLYVVENDVADAFGHVCTGAKMAKVTGTVAEKDGRQWITPTSMEPVEKS